MRAAWERMENLAARTGVPDTDAQGTADALHYVYAAGASSGSQHALQ